MTTLQTKENPITDKRCRLAFDIETDGLLDTVTRIHCIVAQDVDTGEVFEFGPWQIEAGIAKLEEADVLIGHNILSYDLPVLHMLHPGSQLPGLHDSLHIIDTLVCTQLIWTDLRNDDFSFRARRGNDALPGNLIGRHSLEAWGYRLREHKGDFGKSTDWKEWSPKMQQYCVQDVKVATKLFKLIESKEYSQEAVELEHKFRWIVDKQERSGFHFDVKAAASLYAKLSARRAELEQELQAIYPPRMEEMKTPAYYEFIPPERKYYAKASTKGALAESITTWCKAHKRTKKLAATYIQAGPNRVKEHPFNPGSTDEIASRLIEVYGWKPREFTDGGLKPKVTEDVLNGLDYPTVPQLKEYLMLTKRLGQIGDGKQAWLKCQKDGVIYGRVRTNGAVTGRCTHSNPNVAQVPRVGSPYGEECRSLFGPRPGWFLLGCDASGLELRCLAHFTARWDDGSYAREILEGDIHAANQKAAGLAKRDQAKTFIYALCYGAGDEKIGSIVEGTKKEGEKLKATFFEAMPALLLLTDAVKSAAGFVRQSTKRGVFWKKSETNFRGWIQGLDGRKLHIRSAHAALNTLLQSAGALVMKKGLCILWDSLMEAGLKYDEDFMFCANVHDEWQIACRTEEIAHRIGKLAVEAIQKAGEHFNFRCPLDGEYKVGKNWKETH